MNRKQLTILIVLGVVLGGLGYKVYTKKQSGYERGADKAEGQKVLKGVPESAINDVAHITLKQGTAEVNLVKAGSVWTVKERGGHPANFNNLSELVKKVWELKVTRVVEVGPSRLPKLKLTKEEAAVLDLKDDKGKSIAALTLGAQTSKESGEESQFGGGSFPNGRYVMRGDDIKTVALVSDALSVETKPEEWLSKDWFKVEKAKSVSVVTGTATNNWKLSRETDSGEWTLADTKAGESLDSSKASGMNFLLATPSFNDVLIDAKPEATGFTNATTATIQTFEGFTYTFKLGKAAAGEETYALQLTVAGDFAKERVAGKDEKPEDKTKLDKEFADKHTTLEEKLKNEKQFEKWTYLTSKWTIENLLKERKDFLAEKKEEPKAAPGDAPKLDLNPNPLAPPK